MTLGQETTWAYSTTLPSPHEALFNWTMLTLATVRQCVCLCLQCCC